MAKLNMVTGDPTAIRIGEVRFSYAHVFEPHAMGESDTEKYSVAVLVSKDNKEALDLFEKAQKAAIEKGKAKLWGGKVPAKLKLPLRDGDEEHPDDEAYENCMFFNASNTRAPKVCYKDPDGLGLMNATEDDFYSGCYGAIVVNLFPYDSHGNKGVAVSLGNLIKLRDGERFGGGSESVDKSFGDLDDLD